MDCFKYKSCTKKTSNYILNDMTTSDKNIFLVNFFLKVMFHNKERSPNHIKIFTIIITITIY